VFGGDGSVTILSTPGHTPGHQSLLVRLPKTGAILLSGDAVHFRDNWQKPPGSCDEYRQGADAGLDAEDRGHACEKKKAQLWINHDKAQRDGLKMSPEFLRLRGIFYAAAMASISIMKSGAVEF